MSSLSKLLQKYFKRDGLTILVFATFVTGIGFLLYRNPLSTPVTDDWIFYPWQVRQVSPGNWSDLELFIGQQQILVKYSLYLTSFIPVIAAPMSGFTNLIFGSIGIALLIKSQINSRRSTYSPLVIVALIVVSFSLKPLYMYFMATSLGSMQAIFLIGIYFHIKNSRNPTSWVLLPVLFLSPFTFGTGLILILCEIIEQVYRMYKRNIVYTRLKLAAIGATSILAVSIAQVVPALTKNYNFSVGGIPNSPVSGVIESLIYPINTFKFLAIIVGNIFVPSSRFDPVLPLIAGVIFLLISLAIVLKVPMNGTIGTLLENKNCLLAGVLFILLTLIARGVPSAQGFSAASAPRYICGTFIFIIGMLILIADRLKSLHSQIFSRLFLIFVIISVLASGAKTGSEWLSVRNTQTAKLLECLQSRPASELKIGDKCFNLADPVRNPVSDELLLLQLKNFRNYGY